MFNRYSANRYKLLLPIGHIFLLFSLYRDWASCALAQVESPSSRQVFSEDSATEKDRKTKSIKEIMKTDVAPSGDFDFQADKVEFRKDTNTIEGRGSVLISGQGLQIQADRGSSNVTTKDSQLFGNVLVTSDVQSINATSADINLVSEQGQFADADLTMEDGGYNLYSRVLKKVSEFQYKLFDSRLTTCHCPDGYVPWSIDCSETSVTEDGYAHAYNARLKLYGLPAFYLPYMGFPVKSKRQTGLLVPQFGYGSEDGFQYKQPLFMVLDDYSDLTATPFIETRTRLGSSLDFRRVFSNSHSLETHLAYSDESARDGDLRGTVTTGIYQDPNSTAALFDQDRFGGLYKQGWKSNPGALVPSSFIADVHYVSDDLYLREMEDDAIGERQARYALSSVALRNSIGSYVSMETNGEYVQPFEINDDLQVQRLPEFRLNASRSFRPFGYNPYGLKLVPQTNVVVTDFTRDTGYDGWRFDVLPSVAMPFHYQNYFESALQVGVRQTNYQLQETFDPNSAEELEASNSRGLFMLGYNVSTAVERVYDIDRDSWFRDLVSLGSRSQTASLERVKNVIEPFVKYSYVPGTHQDDLPRFDEVDRVREKSLISYGVRTSLLGRFDARRGGTPEISELQPRVEELPTFGMDNPITDINGMEDLGSLAGDISPRKGDVRELASFGIRQNFDYIEAQKDLDASRESFSDIGSDLAVAPTSYFGMHFESNYNPGNQNFSSWGLGTHFHDDRGDLLRARYSFIDDQVSQIEANLELVLADRFRAGAYTRYDDQEHEFIENRIMLRLKSLCNCWHFDVGVTDRINPDKQYVLFSFTFAGLGDVTQNILARKQDAN